MKKENEMKNQYRDFWWPKTAYKNTKGQNVT